MPFKTLSRLLLVAVTPTIFLTACSSLPERNPLPEFLYDVSEVPGIPYARYWSDETGEHTADWFDLSKAELQALYPKTFDKPHNYLAMSGGGPRGAFAAGILNGWTAAGTRPEFTIVTGVSTGALIAPFAFLGPDYDHIIKKIYTQFSTKDILEPRGKLEALTSDAAAETTPLRNKLAEFVDDKLVAAIAAEYQKGRTLVLGTTNMDAGRAVSWNITRIAASGSPDAVQLIRDVMLASAAIPGAFPPVLFTVEAEDQLYDEMHVDGGASSHVFFYPIGLDWSEVIERMEVEGKPNLYVIRNGFLKVDWKPVRRSSLAIARRTIRTLMTNALLGDMYRIYLAAQRDGINYHLAYIPDSFEAKAEEPFDPVYMTKLFNLGYELAKNGYSWYTIPPDYEADMAEVGE